MKLVLIGGPSGGKTTLAQALMREMADQLIVVPEAASILYGGGWPRRKNNDSVRYQQCAIYHVQRELESMLTDESLAERHSTGKSRLLICDRGSLDGLAYWPDRATPEEYLKPVGSLEFEGGLSADCCPNQHCHLESTLSYLSYANPFAISTVCLLH